MNAVRLLLLASFVVLAGCNPTGADKESVKIITDGIFNPISLSYKDAEARPVQEMGEYLLGAPRLSLRFKIKNNSLFPITQMNVEMDSTKSFGFAFYKNADGTGAYPGYSGTCGSFLAPGRTCDVVLQFETSMKGQYEADLLFNYVNLVDTAARPIKLIVTAGNPASLVFKDEINNFFFGNKVGLAQIPVVERNDSPEMEKVLEITNTGDLSARDIALSFDQTCLSKATDSCPSGQRTAYSYEHNCPKILLSQEKCEITLKFAPKNQDPDPNFPVAALNQIQFDGTLQIDYLNSADTGNNNAAVTAFTTSTSTNIEANFETSLKSLPFEEPVVVGNRRSIPLRISNKGFREGKLVRLIIKDENNQKIGYCIRNGTTMMYCYSDSAMTTLLPLSSFPVYFKDHNSCFGTQYLYDGMYIAVDGGCQIEMIYQPSITKTQNGTFAFSVHAEFDSQWKGNQTIRENFLYGSSVIWAAAARLVPVKVSLNNIDYTATTGLTHPVTTKEYYLGRLAMMSANSFKRQVLEITFANEGSTDALGIQAKDGRGTTIPQREINSAGVDLKPSGGDNRPHYSGARISTAFCNQIPPGQRCTISINFAPISKGLLETTRTYMFDQIDTINVLDSYKQFIMNYTDGSFFTDTNRTDTPDSGPNSSSTLIKAALIAKGIIGDFGNKLAGTNVVNGTAFTKYLLVNNIGTDAVRYLGYTGTTSLKKVQTLAMKQYGIRLVPSDLTAIQAANSSSIFGTLRDCLDIVDFNYISTNNCAAVTPLIYSITNPTGLKPLGADESCALSIEYYPSNYRRVSDAPFSTNGGELARNIINEDIGSEAIWGWPAELYFSASISFDYYNNDISDTNAAGNLKECLGGRVATPIAAGGNNGFAATRVHPHSPFPFSSAIIYRPSFVLPELFEEGVSVKSQVIIPQNWFFGSSNFNPTIPVPFTGDQFIYRALNSVNVVPNNIIASGLNINQYEFIVHLGTFPTAKEMSAGFSIAPIGGGHQGGRWQGHSFTTIARPVGSNTNAFTNSLTMNNNTILIPATALFPNISGLTRLVDIKFNGSLPGLYAQEFIYNYTNGEGPSGSPRQIQKRVLVVAEAVSDSPDLEIRSANYTVTTDAVNPATVTPSTSNGFTVGQYSTYPATMGEVDPSTTSYFSAVKIPSPTNKDFFVKRQFVLRNTSTTRPLTNLEFIVKGSVNAITRTAVNFGNNLRVCMSDTPGYCTGNCGGVTTLAPGGTCFFEVFYQPNNTQSSVDLLYSLSFRVADNQFMTRNLKMRFEPFDPAVITAVAMSREGVSTSSAGNIQSFPLNFGTVNMTSNPHVIRFDQVASGLKRIEVRNSSATRASFLKSWHDLNNITDVNMIPSAGDYSFNFNSTSYALIGRKNYSNGTPRILVYASQGCLIGDNTVAEQALPNFRRGFSLTTTTKCFLALELRANINYQNIQLATDRVLHMEPNHMRIPFYDNERASVSFFNIHFRGRFVPNGTNATPHSVAGMYQQVQANSNGQVTFRWQEMTPRNPAMGSIIGYNVYASLFRADLGSLLTQTTLNPIFYFEKNTTGTYTITLGSHVLRSFYYYKVIPVRSHPDYSPNEFSGTTAVFRGLTGNRYLSDTDLSFMTVAIPPADLYYHHASFTFISKNLRTEQLLSFSQAASQCQQYAVALRRNGRNTTLPVSGTSGAKASMITQAVWNTIISVPDASNYDPYTKSVWLEGTTQNIHTKLTGFAYKPNEDAAYLNSHSVYYLKNPGCQPNCTGQKAVGTVYHALEFRGWESYISVGLVFASPRCFINLSTIPE